ncbi:MAG: hypothetical protein K0Q49_1332 [Haloplasmataceae bacterium]|jgi:putative SOS response-associated peptidase YedK|nr:hypothetical protein [Haloplasmataceae bacterium]
MCGRFTISVELEELEEYLSENYNIDEFTLDYKPRYNVSPGQDIISIINVGNKFRVGTLKWGFVPSWASDEKIGNKMINAKSESLAEKPAFKHSFINKRCVILADSFYEWKQVEKEKVPMRIKLKTNEIFPLAGLWSTYTRSNGSKLFTCTIITTTPNELVENIHNRMPVILNKEAEKIWLNPQITDVNILNSILKPYNHDSMDAYQVSSLVNSSKVESSDCIRALI